jgi:hypothetical protein
MARRAPPHATRELSESKAEQCRSIVKQLSALGHRVACDFESREANIVAMSDKSPKIPAELRAAFTRLREDILFLLERGYVRHVTKQGDELMGCNATALLERCFAVFPGARFLRRTINGELASKLRQTKKHR